MKYTEGKGADPKKCINCGSADIEDLGLHEVTEKEQQIHFKKYDPKSQ